MRLPEDRVTEVLFQLESEFEAKLPPDYIGFLRATDTWSRPPNAPYFELWDINRVLKDNRNLPQRTSHPGLLVIGTDGSREMIGLDLRKTPPPIVLVDISSSGWSDAFFQANSFSEFLKQVQDRGFQWVSGYEEQGP